jgi:hypothetical protein
MFTLLALTEKRLGPGITGIGKIGGNGLTGCDNITFFVDIISKVIGILTIAAVLWFVIQFILGGFSWMTASGDAKQIESARMQIIHAIIGLVIVFSAMIFLGLVGFVFGIQFLEMENLIRNIGVVKSC